MNRWSSVIESSLRIEGNRDSMEVKVWLRACGITKENVMEYELLVIPHGKETKYILHRKANENTAKD